MSQSQHPKGARGGSVRRAKESVDAGLPPEMPFSTQSPPRQRAGDVERGPGTVSPTRPRQPMPAALSASRDGGQGIGMAISRPTQVPQWPLAVPVQGNLGQETLLSSRQVAARLLNGHRGLARARSLPCLTLPSYKITRQYSSIHHSLVLHSN